MKNKKVLSLFALSLVASCAAVAAVTVASQEKFRVGAEEKEYEVNINEEGIFAETQNDEVTIGSTKFRTHGVHMEDGGVGTFQDPNSFIQTMDDLWDVRSFKAEFSGGDLVLKTTKDNKTFDSEFPLESGVAVDLTDYGVRGFRIARPEGSTDEIQIDSVSYKHKCNPNKVAPACVIEDGSAESDEDLADQYDIKKYDNGWVTTGATVKLADTKEKYSEGNVMNMHYWRNSSAFKYAKNISINGNANTVHIKYKGYASSSMALRLNINSGDYAGMYADYKIDLADSNWHEAYIPVGEFVAATGQGSMKMSALLSYLQIPNMETAVKLFDGFSFILKGTSNNGDERNVYVDDVELIKTTITEAMDVALITYSSGTAILKRVGFDMVELTSPVTEKEMMPRFSIDEGDSGFISNISASEFRVYDDGGLPEFNDTFELFGDTSEVNQVIVVEDFESYKETGVGYDKNNAKSKRSGLRGAYYHDYYSGGSGSPVGGNGWSLMGSTDYAKLDTNATNRLDYKIGSNTMRFMSYNLYEGVYAPIGYGSKFVFTATGIAAKAYTISVRVFYGNSGKVTASTQQTNSTSKDITVAQGSGVTQYAVDLDATKEYCGFALTFKSGPQSAQRAYIDNIAIIK